MTTQQVVEFLIAFLGGGIVAATGNWIYNWRSTRRQREVERLREQLAGLYGPLFFFTTQNEQIFTLVEDINAAYEVHFNRQWSQDDTTQARVEQQAHATIDLANTYVDRVVQNNERVMQILETHWHLVDPEDISVLAKFQVDYVRFRTEVRDEQRRPIPHAIYRSLGEISYMRPQMIQTIAQAVSRKRDRLSRLGWSPTQRRP